MNYYIEKLKEEIESSLDMTISKVDVEFENDGSAKLTFHDASGEEDLVIGFQNRNNDEVVATVPDAIREEVDWEIVADAGDETLSGNVSPTGEDAE